MVILRRSSEKLRYCPFLPIVASILLLFVPECDALKITRIMVSESERMLHEEGQFNRAEELRGLRWYLPLDKKDYFATIETFMTFMRDRSASIRTSLDYLKSIGMDGRAFMQEQFSHFFLDYIPLDIIYMLFPAYLNEGIKILFRIGYGFFKTLKEYIKCCKNEDDFRNNCRQVLAMMTDDDKKRFINTCYQLRIVRIKKQFSLLDANNESNNVSCICEPCVVGEDSRILTKPNHLTELFQFVPSIFKTNDLKLIFATWRDGRSMQSLIKTADSNYHEGAAFLLSIVDEKGTIFGAFLEHSLSKDHCVTKCGSCENFLFRLVPEPECYRGVLQKGAYYKFDGSDVYIGACATGCGLILDADLKEGHTSKSDVYDCPPLTLNGNRVFTIANLELFVFV